MTDISAIKWAEGVQKRKMEDAIEAKRQQENFIDVTSHEMRNPLSAIMISGESIGWLFWAASPYGFTDFPSGRYHLIVTRCRAGL